MGKTCSTSEETALVMINSLKSAKIFDGYRGNYPINKDEFAQIESRHIQQQQDSDIHL